MPSSKPHIVLIPGALHTSEAYHLIVPLLSKAGYEATALTLPSVGAEPPIKSLDPEIAHVRNTVIPLIEKGEDVVVVMHSYGGAAGGTSLRGLSKAERQSKGETGGVKSLVYLCAWMIPEGQSVMACGGGQGGKGGSSMVKAEV